MNEIYVYSFVHHGPLCSYIRWWLLPGQYILSNPILENNVIWAFLSLGERASLTIIDYIDIYREDSKYLLNFVIHATRAFNTTRKINYLFFLRFPYRVQFYRYFVE